MSDRSTIAPFFPLSICFYLHYTARPERRVGRHRTSTRNIAYLSIGEIAAVESALTARRHALLTTARSEEGATVARLLSQPLWLLDGG